MTFVHDLFFFRWQWRNKEGVLENSCSGRQKLGKAIGKGKESQLVVCTKGSLEAEEDEEERE